MKIINIALVLCLLSSVTFAQSNNPTDSEIHTLLCGLVENDFRTEDGEPVATTDECLSNSSFEDIGDDVVKLEILLCKNIGEIVSYYYDKKVEGGNIESGFIGADDACEQ